MSGLAYPWVAHQPDDDTFQDDAWISDDDDRMVAGHLRASDVDCVVACVNACEGLADPSVVPELLAALNGMVGLVQLIQSREPDLLENHRFREALRVIAKAEGR